jgi:hypothetical protein
MIFAWLFFFVRVFCAHHLLFIVVRFDTLRDQMNKLNKDSFDAYENDTDASPECNELFMKLEQNAVTRVLWMQVKPFFRFVTKPRYLPVPRSHW